MRYLTVFWWSLRETLQQPRTRWALLALFICLQAAWLWGAERVQREEAGIAQALTENRRLWLVQPPQSPHGAAHYPVLLVRPPGPLSTLAAGQAALQPSFIYTDAHRRVPARGSRTRPLVPPLDVAWVMAAVGALLAVLAGADALASARAHGVLRQVLAAAIAPAGWLAAALNGRLVALWLGVALVGGVAWVGAGAPTLPVGHLGLFALFSALYLAVWLWLGALVALRAPRPSIAALLALGLWVVLVVVAPRTLATVSEWDAPFPDGAAARAALRVEEVRLRQEQARMVETLRAQGGLKGATGFTAMEGPVAVRDVIDAAAERARAREEAEQVAWQGDQLRRQAAWAWVSPAGLYQTAVTGIAGTDARQHTRFEAEAEAWRKQFLVRLNGLEDAGVKEFNAYAAVMPFEFSKESWRAAGLAQWRAWLWLLLLWWGAMGLALWRFERHAGEV